jgi:hypothetical protein
MKTLAIILVATGLAMTGCGKKAETSQKPPATNTTSTSDTNSYLGGPVDYLGAINRAQKVAIKTIDTASLRKNIDLFFAQEDRYPKDLDELIAKHYLPELPKLPRGMVYDYDPKTGALKVLKTP